MKLLINIFDNGLKYQEIKKDKFSVRNILECYNILSRGKLEPTLIIVSDVLNQFVEEVSNLLPNKDHINSRRIWSKFRNASVVISGELEHNQMFIMNLNALDNERYNALVTFEQE